MLALRSPVLFIGRVYPFPYLWSEPWRPCPEICPLRINPIHLNTHFPGQNVATQKIYPLKLLVIQIQLVFLEKDFYVAFFAEFSSSEN